MPFVQRVIQPVFLSRTSLSDGEGKPLMTDGELEAVTNCTLSNALRQLASLALVAEDIFTELNVQLQEVTERSTKLKTKISEVERRVASFDPKKVAVPEGDINTFSLLRTHFKARQEYDGGLFSVSTRPLAIKQMYEAATKTPIHVMRQLDRWRRDGHRSSRFFMCTPVLGAKRRRIRNNVDIEIETRMPAVIEDLRRWTSSEALGDVTVATDGARILSSTTYTDGDITDGMIASDDEAIDHKLPSPEEQLQVVALKFPAVIVAVNVTGKAFDRMCDQRRSLLHADFANKSEDNGTNSRRRTRARKPRGRRRNTLAGTDQKEIRDALTASEEPSSSIPTDEIESPIYNHATVPRSKSSDLLKKESPDNKKSHFSTLKQWGKSRLKIFTNYADSKSEKVPRDPEDVNIYETVTLRRKRSVEKERKSFHERKPSSSSEKSSKSVLEVGTVKLRESSLQRRLRRSGGGKDEPHSSSGNWSASSESGRASIGSEITTHPKSTTTSSNSLNQPPSSVNSRRRFVNNSSTTSEGTLTPDIIHDLHEDETSSVYSCDTEGYYTSFHMDSGLKTLKEEESPATPLHTTSALNGNLSAENEYELFGKGSTSTTTSSAGTVCTTLRASDSYRSLTGPAVPERKSSLINSPQSSLERDFSEKTGTVKRSPCTTKASITKGDVSPDSGHNTSSSPIESISSPNCVRSGSEFEFSESSDMEGPDRIERIRVKTTINSSRIPSMCVITPSQSDDESVNSEENKVIFENNRKICEDHQNEDNRRYNEYNRINSVTNISNDDMSWRFNHVDNGNISEGNVKRFEDIRKSSDDNQISSEDSQRINKNIDSENNNNKIQVINVNPQTGYATIENHVTPDVTKASHRAPSPSGGSVTIKPPSPIKSPQLQPILKATLLPLNNMLGRLKLNFNNFNPRGNCKSPLKPDESINSDSGDYVTIADVRNNNEKKLINNDEVNRNLSTVLSGKIIRDTEYISLNELNESRSQSSNDSLERKKRGARVTLDSEGKVIYSSDSLKRKKGAQTTFEPGPCVKLSQLSPVASHRTPAHVRPVKLDESRPLSPQLGKVVIKSSGMSEVVRMPPVTIVSPGMVNVKQASRGAYVNVQDEGRETTPSNSSNYHQYNYQENSKYNTLPNRKPHYIPALPDRSVTPDITRGLNHSYHHQSENYNPEFYKPELFRPELYKPDVYRPDLYKPEVYRPELYNTELQIHDLQSREHELYNQQLYKHELYNRDVYNRELHNQDLYSRELYNQELITQELGIPNYDNQSRNYNEYNSFRPNNDSNLRISPIDPRNVGGFQSSTPSKDNKNLRAATNLENKLLSPKKSTMSNEELYAAIHKSKKKMNIDEVDKIEELKIDELKITETLSPSKSKPPESGYLGARSVSTAKSIKKDKSDPQLSRLDFKKLLLTHGKVKIKAAPKISAVEQLKLSKDKLQQSVPSKQEDISILDLSQSPRRIRKFSSQNALSPKSQWRFANPRSDVLSSTIHEDCQEEEGGDGSSIHSNTNTGLLGSKERLPQMTATQRLQAQRAKFFSNNRGAGVKKAAPTLETAF